MIQRISIPQVRAVAPPADPQPDYVIQIRNMAFEVPPNFKVKVGDVIQFVNSEVTDHSNHTVTSETEGPDGRPLFRLRVNRGESKTLVVDESWIGVQNFFCEFHPMMTGQVTVEAAEPPVAAKPARSTDSFQPAHRRN